MAYWLIFINTEQPQIDQCQGALQINQKKQYLYDFAFRLNTHHKFVVCSPLQAEIYNNRPTVVKYEIRYQLVFD